MRAVRWAVVTVSTPRSFLLHHSTPGTSTCQYFSATSLDSFLLVHPRRGMMGTVWRTRRMADEKFLTVPEVAARLRAAEETVRRWLRSGKLRGRMIGGTRLGYRVAESEV